jgi:hypothetical protein
MPATNRKDDEALMAKYEREVIQLFYNNFSRLD